MARVYSPNPHHSCDYGVDFVYGAAMVPDADTVLCAWFVAKGYTVVAGSDVLTPWDRLPIEQLRIFAPYVGILNGNALTKQALVAAIETALITLMKIEITAFDAIADVTAGTVAVPLYANANAVKAVLPATVKATIGTNIAVNVPVTAWVDTDNYNAAAAAKYTFTATLGALPLPFANTAAVTATVEVEVKA